MGQAQATSTWGTYEPSYETTPGTYRIVHDATNKTLQIHEVTQMLIIRDREDPSSDTGREQNDHWFIIRSGDAFIFKHCQSENYISGLPWLPANARPICATHYPSTWAIRVKKDSDDPRCAITIPVGWNEFQSKSGYIGIGVNSGNVRLCFIPLSGKEELDHIWRLERIGDTTFEEDCAHKVREMERQLSAANDRCASSELKLQAMQQQLDTQKAEVACLHSELSTQAAELKRTQIESNQQSTELKQQNEVLGKIRKLLDTKERSLPERIKGSCENNETAPEKVQGEMLRQLEVAGGEVVDGEGLDARERAMSEKGRVVSENGIISEEDEVSQGEGRPPSLRSEEAALIERAAPGETNNVPASNASAPLPDHGSQPEMQTQPDPTSPAQVDHKLTELGWLPD